MQAQDFPGENLPRDLFKGFKKFLRSHLTPWSISQDRRETSAFKRVVPSLLFLKMRVFLKHIHILARLLIDQDIPAVGAIDGVSTIDTWLLLLHF